MINYTMLNTDLYDSLNLVIEEVTTEAHGKKQEKEILRSSNPIVFGWFSWITKKAIHPIKLAIAEDTVKFDKNSEYYQDYSHINNIKSFKDDDIIPNKMYIFNGLSFKDLDLLLRYNLVGLGDFIHYDRDNYHEFTLAETFLGSSKEKGYITNWIQAYIHLPLGSYAKAEDIDDRKKLVIRLMDTIENDLYSINEIGMDLVGLYRVHLEEMKKK